MKTIHEAIEIEVYESSEEDANNLAFWWYIASEDKNSTSSFPTPELALADAKKSINEHLQRMEDAWTDKLHN